MSTSRFAAASVLAALPLALLIVQGLATGKEAKQSETGEVVFRNDCTACHADKNSNIVNPDKTLAKSKQLKDLKTFKAFLGRPNGQMPAYKTIVRNKKTLNELYDYIKSLK